MFDHVCFAYDKKKVLENVSFTAREGEVTALVGPSGSGKSTCARLAARLWDAAEGTIQVGGVDISAVDPEVLLRDYSMVFQDVVLFAPSAAGSPVFSGSLFRFHRSRGRGRTAPSAPVRSPAGCRTWPCPFYQASSRR